MAMNKKTWLYVGLAAVGAYVAYRFIAGRGALASGGASMSLPQSFTLPQGLPGGPGVAPIQPGATASRFAVMQRLGVQAAQQRYQATSGYNQFRIGTVYATRYQNDPRKQLDVAWIANDPDFANVAAGYGAR